MRRCPLETSIDHNVVRKRPQKFVVTLPRVRTNACWLTHCKCVVKNINLEGKLSSAGQEAQEFKYTCYALSRKSVMWKSRFSMLMSLLVLQCLNSQINISPLCSPLLFTFYTILPFFEGKKNPKSCDERKKSILVTSLKHSIKHNIIQKI